MAEDFLLDSLSRPLPGLIPRAHEEGAVDDVFQLIRYGVVAFDPETKKVRWIGPRSRKQVRAIWRRIDAENP
jgi:hypothetical protein